MAAGYWPAAALALGAPRMREPCTPETLLEAVRGLRVAEPDLGYGDKNEVAHVNAEYDGVVVFCGARGPPAGPISHLE